MVTIKRLTVNDLRLLKLSDDFHRWISSKNESGKKELKELLRQRLMDGEDVWVAVEDDVIIGFAVIVDWAAMPGGKALESMEVARSHRRKGIGSLMIRSILENYNTIMVLTPSPEAGYEKALEDFYERFGFKHMPGDVMVRIPDDRERLRRWVKYLGNVLEVYEALLNEMKGRLEEVDPY